MRLLFAVSALLIAPAAAESSVATLMSWWSGVFDNRAQQPGPFFALTGVHRRVDAPAIGSHVLYVAEYKDTGPHVIRLQILAEQPDGSIRVSFAPLREPGRFMVDGHEPDRDKLKAISAADVIRFNPACDLIMRREGDRFTGRMAPRGCKRGAELYFEYESWVSEGEYAFREQARRLSDDSVGWEQAPGSSFGEFRMVKRR